MDNRLQNRRTEERLIADCNSFVRANTRFRSVPLVPEISLYLADEAREHPSHDQFGEDRNDKRRA